MGEQILQIEQAVLGIALRFEGVDARLVEAHFTDARHRTLYGTIRSLAERGRPVDLVTVAQQLNGTLEAAGGAAYLAELSQGVPTDVHLHSYADALIEAYGQRRAFEALKRHAALFAEGQGDVGGLIGELSEITGASDQRAQWHTVADLVTYQLDAASIIAGDGWLRRGACTILTGGTGTGKSVLALQIACCVASGTNIFRGVGQGIEVAKARRVLVVQAENDQACLQRDLLGIVGHEKLNQVALCSNMIVATYSGDTPERFGSWLAQALRRFPADMVVVDPYSAFIGGVDVNSSESFFRFRDAIAPVLAGVAMLLTTHTPKPADRSNWSARDSVYLAMGTSALANWARCSAELTNPCVDQDSRYRVRLGKNAERAALPPALGGGVTRDIWLEHGDKAAPCWIVASDQDDPTVNAFQRLQELVTANPEITQRAAAKILGVSAATVCRFMREIAKDKR